MKKRIGVITLLLLLVMTSTVYGFSDIKETDWFYKDIKGLKEQGVIAGYDDGTYRPKNDITKAETLTMILNAANIQITKMSSGHWATGTLLTASKEGIVSDISAFYFDDKATRGEVAEYVVKALKIEVNEEVTGVFKDTDNIYANTLYTEGIINGVTKNNEVFYYADNPITRAEIGAIVSRVIEYQKDIEGFKESQRVEEVQKEETKPLEEETQPIEETQSIEEEVKNIVELVKPLKDSEYDISKSSFKTSEDFKKLFVHMGYNNLITEDVTINGYTHSNIRDEGFKEMVRLSFKEVFGKYPEYYSFANSLSYKGKSYIDYVELEFNLRNASFTDSEIKKYRGEFITKVDEQLNKFIENGDITSDMTEYDIAKFLFEWVVNNTEYDYSFKPISYTGYGQIQYGRAVCQGYTATYNLMLKRLGIKAYGITGQAGFNQKEEHIWTIAYLDGQRYHIDATWGDSYGKTTGEVDYNYFATNGEKLSKTHQWDRNMFGD